MPQTEHSTQTADQDSINDKGTRLMVCAAVAGAAGLTSDVLLGALGRFIGQWLTIVDFRMQPESSTANFNWSKPDHRLTSVI